MNIGAVVTAFLTFLITAAVVYFIFVAPMNRINRMVKNRLNAAEPEEEPIPADTALLAEIRDLLANRPARSPTPPWPRRGTPGRGAPGREGTLVRPAGTGSRAQPDPSLPGPGGGRTGVL